MIESLFYIFTLPLLLIALYQYACRKTAERKLRRERKEHLQSQRIIEQLAIENHQLFCEFYGLPVDDDAILESEIIK
jgi:hypothetical protein